MNLGNLECTSLATPECKRKSLIPKALLLATRFSECSNVGQSRQVFGTRERALKAACPSCFCQPLIAGTIHSD
jgi:hypothetical protein